MELEGGQYRLWIVLRFPISSKKSLLDPFYVERVRVDVRELQPKSVVVMQYNPHDIQYVYLQNLNNSGLPGVVVEGFRLKMGDFHFLSELGEEIIPLLPQESIMVDFDRSKYLGAYDDGYFASKPDENAHRKIPSAGVRQFMYKLFLMKQVRNTNIQSEFRKEFVHS
jgi:hypothetical protein